MKTYGTLEALANAPEAEVAQLLHLRSDAATKLLMAARVALKQQNERKEEQKKSLEEAGTTWQKAAHHKQIADLAELASEEF